MVDAETYDRYLVPAIFEPWSRELIKRAQVWKGDRVLDVACGTGIVACRTAASGATVTAIDNDAARIAQAKRRASDEGVSVKWIEGSALALPFRQPAFDLVTCQQGIAHVDDPALAAREMRRVIAPGGRAVVASWLPIGRGPYNPYNILDELADRHFGKRFGRPFALDDAALKKLLVDAKFFAVNVEVVTRQVRVPDPARFAAVTLENIAGAPTTPGLATAEAEALDALAPFLDDGQLVFPMVSAIAVARVKT